MKRKINIKTIRPVALLLVMLAIIGCSDDFLNVVPTNTYTEDTYYASDEALRLAVDPLYNRAWFDFHGRSMFGLGSLRAGDAYNAYFMADFVRFQTTALTGQVGDAWKSIYAVVSMSNAVIDGVSNKCGSEVTQEAKDRALGEVYLWRATAYFFGLRIWGPMILSEDNVEIVGAPIRPLNTEEDVFTFILRDLRRACDLLPATEDPTGRATVWAAKAMLAKVLLAHSGWNKPTRDESELAECIKLCEEIIEKSGAKLIDYEDLFKYQNNINKESLLAFRWRVAPSAIWGTQNSLLSDISFAEVCDVECWGHDLCATPDMIDLYNMDYLTHDSIRRRATFFIPGEHYSYIKSDKGGYTYPIGKDSPDRGWMQLKKGVVGTLADNDGNISTMNSPLHTHIIRLAEVHLTHAEASLGNKAELTGGKGLASYNAVRDRAGVHTKGKINFQDIINERRIEFSMEYQTWFDMVTWYRWKPDFMLKYFKAQRRGYEIRNNSIRMNADGSISWNAFGYSDADGNLIWDSVEGYAEATESFVPTVITPENIFIPYPEADRLMNPYLSQAPEPYDFSKYE